MKIKAIFISVAIFFLVTNIRFAFSEELKFGEIKINEIYPDNDPHEWVELINMARDEVNINGYFLSDGDNLFKIEREKPLKPMEIILIVAPGSDGKWPKYQEPNNKNWGISKKKQEAVMILDPQKQMIVDFMFKPEKKDNFISFGRYPDGNDDLHFFSKPTKGDSNKMGKEYHSPPKLSFFDSFKQLLQTTGGIIFTVGSGLGWLGSAVGGIMLFRKDT